MKQTKIEWADMTWNPVTGCLHFCEYCYARKIARRFSGNVLEHGNCHVVDQRKVCDYHEVAHCTGPFPYGFDPTLYVDRLSEPQKCKKPQTIFVCSMADLFGEWVPSKWQQEVFKACLIAPQHRYLFLTKNPVRVKQIERDGLLPDALNFWYGVTITHKQKAGEMGGGAYYAPHLSRNKFISFEPLLEELNPGSIGADWAIIGAETGKRIGRAVPQRAWIEEIVSACRKENIPVFMKESIRELMGDDFVQEFPWEV